MKVKVVKEINIEIAEIKYIVFITIMIKEKIGIEKGKGIENGIEIKIRIKKKIKIKVGIKKKIKTRIKNGKK